MKCHLCFNVFILAVLERNLEEQKLTSFMQLTQYTKKL